MYICLLFYSVLSYVYYVYYTYTWNICMYVYTMDTYTLCVCICIHIYLYIYIYTKILILFPLVSVIHKSSNPWLSILWISWSLRQLGTINGSRGFPTKKMMISYDISDTDTPYHRIIDTNLSIDAYWWFISPKQLRTKKSISCQATPWSQTTCDLAATSGSSAE